MCAVSVGASTASSPEAGPGAIQTSALHQIRVGPIPFALAKEVVEGRHYLHSMSGGNLLPFGVFLLTRLLRHFRNHGVPIRTVPQSPNHRYLYFLDPSWRDRLRVSVLPYPRRDSLNGHC